MGLHQLPEHGIATLIQLSCREWILKRDNWTKLSSKEGQNDIILVQVMWMISLWVTKDTNRTKLHQLNSEALVKDEEASGCDVHLYRSLDGSLMYVTASRPDIMFAVCACSRFQVTPKTSHLSAVKRIFRKSTTGGSRIVAAASCCGQVLWIQNQMLDYGFNFMNTKIYIDNESTICIVKNPVYHSKTKIFLLGTTSFEMLMRKEIIQLEVYMFALQKVIGLFKSKKIAQVVRAWIQSKNSLVKHFEDMRLCRPSKEYLPVWFDPPRDESMSCLTQRGCVTMERCVPALISLTDDLSLLSNMAALESCPKHNILSDEQPSPSPAPTSEVPYEPHTDSSPAHTSEVPFEQQPDPSPRPSPKPSPTPIVPDSIPEPTGENLGDHSSNDTSLSGNEDDMTLQNVYDLCISLCKQVSDQAKEIKLLKAKINKLKKQAQPVIKHHKAYLKTVSLQQRFPRKSFSKKHRMHKESVSKQGRKIAKGESSVQRDPLFDVMPEDKIDHMETENAQSEGRTREMVDEDKEFDES
ncbi:hypothetical protein Tco_1055184 [Tanacetum coccineum]|uniref:Uncharacterized protein n=1 Tax=Tanacetum coccineum TaxID=301880 RepID=A0ABQ5H0Z6_9ASTR